MGSDFVQPSDLILSPDPSSSGCQFEDENGVKCGLQNVLARGYCQRHYRQLSRLGVFSELEKRTNTADSKDLDLLNAERLVQARSILQRAAPRVARFAIKTAKEAISKGDIKPAAWILIHSGAISPVEKTAPTKNVSGVTVNVGVKLAGVKESDNATTVVVESESESDNV